MSWHNFGIGGGTITAEVYSLVTGKPKHWVCRNIDNIHNEVPELDYLIPEDYSEQYDDTTFCGAVETLFFKALNYYPNAKIGFTIAPKIDAWIKTL